MHSTTPYDRQTKPWRIRRVTLQAWARRGAGDPRRGLEELEQLDPYVLATETRLAAHRALQASLETLLGHDNGERIGELLVALTTGLTSTNIDTTDTIAALEHILDLQRGFRVLAREHLQELRK